MAQTGPAREMVPCATLFPRRCSSEEQALDFWRNGGYDFDLVLVTEDGRVVITAGLADRFEEVKDSGYTYETVS